MDKPTKEQIDIIREQIRIKKEVLRGIERARDVRNGYAFGLYRADVGCYYTICRQLELEILVLDETADILVKLLLDNGDGY